jgi:acyl carrier protein
LVTETVRTFILQNFPSAKQRAVGNDDPLLENGIVDSLGVLDIVSFIESEFGVSAVDDDLVPENFQTIRRISDYIEKKRNGKT